MDRCNRGGVPFAGTTIDESSGSTGTPYNWIRGRRERELAHRNIAFFARYAFGTAPLVTINAFSMGAWAAGFNMSLGMMRHGIVKSIGPDLDKILSTLTVLGPTYRFLISGYPPFLKHLLDEGDRRGFPWADYEIHGLVGGEGMTEELRDLLLLRFVSVFSGYGATDIEIGMAGESPVSIARASSGARPSRHRPEAVRHGFAPADGVPVQPADPLHGGQRPRRGHLHGVEARPAGAKDPVQRPRLGRDRSIRRRPPSLARVRLSTWMRSARRPRLTDRAAHCRGLARSRCPSCGSTAGATRRSA